MTVAVLQGDCREVLATLPDSSVQMVCTSPPYYSLRDYGTATWKSGDPTCDHVRGKLVHRKSTLRNDGRAYTGPYEAEKSVTTGMPYKDRCGKCGAIRVDKQIGLEQSPSEYVAQMVAVFREVRRVLRPDGVAWINIGDSFGKGKQLQGIPWRVAFALQDDGWYLRSDIIWSKPNPMPESVRDRPTRAHEYLFMLSKSQKYFFDAEAIAEPFADARMGCDGSKAVRERNRGGRTDGFTKPNGIDPSANGGRNARSVWTIASEPTGGFHDFAGADYVDDRGIPRKRSPDCPIHGQDERLRRGTLLAGADDELLAAHPSRTRRTDSHPDQALLVAVAETVSYTTLSASDNPSGQTQDDISWNRRPVSSTVESGTDHCRQGTLARLDPSTEDYSRPEDSLTAIENNNETSRTGPVPEMSLLGTLFDETLSSTPCTSPKPECAETDLHIDASSVSSRAVCPSVQRTLSKPGMSSCIKSKCSCPVSQHQHYAIMPTELARRCILAGTSEKGRCPSCGAPWARVTERLPGDTEAHLRPKRTAGMSSRTSTLGLSGNGSKEWAERGSKQIALGWAATCTCAEHEPVPCTVLDPFAGVGTTLLVADRLGRHGIGIELNPASVAIARRRLVDDAPLLVEVA